MTFADTSAIVDGQPIDAADVKAPIDALDAALTDVLAGAAHPYARALFAEQTSTPATTATQGALYLKSSGLWLRRSGSTDLQLGSTNDITNAFASPPVPIGGSTATAGYFTTLYAASIEAPSTNGTGLWSTTYLHVTPTGGLWPDGEALLVRDQATTTKVLAVNTSTKTVLVSNNADQAILEITGIATGSNNGGILRFNHSRGTVASPTVTQSGDGIGLISFRGYDGSTYQSGARVRAVATANLSASNRGMSLVFIATQAGGTTPVEQLTVSGNQISVAGACEVNGALTHKGSTVGFYNTTPTAKPTISGSRGGNAALASLLTALASLGLITDSSS